MFGPRDGRDEVPLRGKQLPSGRIDWQGDDLLDAERLLKAGAGAARPRGRRRRCEPHCRGPGRRRARCD